jgi:hypothetical protein
MKVEGHVGPARYGDNQDGPLRLDNYGGVLGNDSLGFYAEQVMRGNGYVWSTAIAGVALVAQTTVQCAGNLEPAEFRQDLPAPEDHLSPHGSRHTAGRRHRLFHRRTACPRHRDRWRSCPPIRRSPAAICGWTFTAISLGCRGSRPLSLPRPPTRRRSTVFRASARLPRPERPPASAISYWSIASTA